MQEFSSFKKIIFIIALCICIFIIYSLIQERNKLLTELSTSEKTQEGFASTSLNPMPTIRNTSMTDTLPLKEYLIMASWNSCAEDAYTVSLRQLKKVLENGCRFLDFEVYNIDDKPVIGYSSSGYISSQPNQEIDSNTLNFRDVCNVIASAASYAPNKDDPLFIHFRVKTNNMKILEKMSIDFVASGIKDKGIETSINSNLLLSGLQNKIIILIDKTYVPNIENDVCKAGCEIDIRSMIDYSGVSSFTSTKLSQQLQQNVRPLQKQTDDRTNTTKWKMITHDFGTQYMDRNASYQEFQKLVMDHRIQIIPFKFQYPDEGLTEYKNFFSDNGHNAFIPMAVAHDALLFSSSN